MSESAALAYWMGSDRETFVADGPAGVVGTFYLKANQAGGGRHVCNCGYMTLRTAAGKGVARTMCERSIELAKARDFSAMQFNFVVSTNKRAIHLWQSLGFDVVGCLPGAFNHPADGPVDALVMYRNL
jgi:GNAT superfamily N-acetyltransferase